MRNISSLTRAAVAAIAASVVVNFGIWLVARGLHVDLLVPEAPGSATFAELPIGAVVGATAFPSPPSS
ncbi:hypothetical protein BH23ACT3_BH23ACT3_09490 [soil metagenome]